MKRLVEEKAITRRAPLAIKPGRTWGSSQMGARLKTVERRGSPSTRLAALRSPRTHSTPSIASGALRVTARGRA